MATAQLSMESIEQVLVKGDLAQLTTEQRVEYHNLVCKSIGLNPLTRPFNFLVLNGKTVLYATRDCGDQLRKINGVSISSLDSKVVGDLIVVTVSAKDRSDRTDFSTGVVNTKGLVGADLANAMMKAETKAKRRVTLSLCGLGVLDETEIEPDEHTGAIEREVGAPQLTAPAKAVIPDNGEKENPKHGDSKILYYVGKTETTIAGRIYAIKDNLKSLGAKLDASKKWKMPAGRTHELLAVCDVAGVAYQELDENGKPVIDLPKQESGYRAKDEDIPF